MRILSCHINNFGVLHNLSYSFDDGLTRILEPNGWGKSTFAAFLSAMFYGLSGSKKRSIEENERKRYLPWQGGSFGGELTFEINGSVYTITRKFGQKENADIFELRNTNTNRISNDYSNNIGEEVFKIDKESFLRTILISQNDCETSVSDSINAKISDLSAYSDDLGNYDEAKFQLSRLLNQLSPDRKTGSISRRQDEITNLTRIVTDGKSISEKINHYSNDLAELEDEYKQTRQKITEVTEKQKKQSAQAVKKAKNEEYRRLQMKVADAQANVDKARQQFPDGVPDIERIKKAIVRSSEMRTNIDTAKAIRLSETEKNNLKQYRSFFGAEIPSSDEINRIKEDVLTIQKATRETGSQLSEWEKTKYQELDRVFCDIDYDAFEAESNWNQRTIKKESLSSKEAMLSSMDRRTNPISVALLCFGVILIGTGAYLAFAKQNIIGYICLAIGVIAIIAFIALKGKNNSNTQIEALKQTIVSDKEFINKIEDKTRALLTQLGIEYDVNTVESRLKEVNSKYKEYKELQGRVNMYSESENDKNTIKSLSDSVTSYMRQFYPDFNLYDNNETVINEIYQIEAAANKYREILKKYSGYIGAKNKANESYEKIVEILRGYGYQEESDLEEQLTAIKDAIEDYDHLNQILQSANHDLIAFEKANDTLLESEEHSGGLFQSMEELGEIQNSLTDQLENIQVEINQVNNTLDNLREQYDEWENCKNELQEKRELQDQEMKKYRNIRYARDLLEKAKENLIAKYSEPIHNNFCRYFSLLTGENTDGFRTDANSEITVYEYGIQREKKSLSNGYRDLIGFCQRLSLIDAMYKAEKPVLIMDDPFTNLDDHKLVEAMKLLDKLSENYQIIYFTCSSSR